VRVGSLCDAITLRWNIVASTERQWRDALADLSPDDTVTAIGPGTIVSTALLQDARGEIRAVLDGGIELAEKTAASVFRFARKITARVDEGVAETLAGTERLLGGAVKSARETAKSASDTANTALAGVAGAAA